MTFPCTLTSSNMSIPSRFGANLPSAVFFFPHIGCTAHAAKPSTVRWHLELFDEGTYMPAMMLLMVVAKFRDV